VASGELLDRLDDPQSRPDGTLRVVLVGARVAEEHQDAIAEATGNVTVEPLDDQVTGLFAGTGEVGDLLGVRPRPFG
jgi:hypothetical protein